MGLRLGVRVRVRGRVRVRVRVRVRISPSGLRGERGVLDEGGLVPCALFDGQGLIRGEG